MIGGPFEGEDGLEVGFTKKAEVLGAGFSAFWFGWNTHAWTVLGRLD